MSVELLKTICYFLTGGFLIFLAITITRDNFASRINRITGAMLFFAGLGPVFMALAEVMAGTGAALETSALFGLRHLWEFFFPFLLLFSWLFPVDRLAGFRHSRWRHLVFLPPVLHVLISLLFADVIGLLEAVRVDPDTTGLMVLILRPLAKVVSWLRLLMSVVLSYEKEIFTIVNLAYVVGAIYFLEAGRRLVSNPRIRTQTRWVVWGMRLGLGLLVVAQIGAVAAPAAFSQQAVSSLLVAALLMGSALIIFATIRHQFLDVQMVFRQSFVITITSGILVGIYVAMVLRARSLLDPMFGQQAELISYGFIVLILLLFQPINAWLDNLVRSLFIRTRTDHRNVIERFSRQVISVIDPVQLRRIIEETFKTTLLVDRVYFVQYDDGIGEYTLLPSEDYPKRIVVSRQDILLRGINLLDSPTYYHSLADYRADSALAPVLESRGVKMVLPMKDANHMLGFVALTGKAAGYRYSSEDLNLLGVLSNQMVSALTTARLHIESLERTRLQEEVNMARQIQLDLLPHEPPCLPCSVIAAVSNPSRTVGGDFYDFVRVDEQRLGIVIADASGKGMPAALMIAQTQAMLRSEVNNGSPIATMLRNMNELMQSSTSSEKFVTLFYAELDIATGRLRYVNAGHNYPVLVRRDGSVEQLETGGPLLGALPHMEYESAEVMLSSEDLLFLFTDGLSEAMNEREEEYGEKRVVDLLRRLRSEEPSRIIDTVLEDVHRFDPTSPPRDDTTIVALKMIENRLAHGTQAQ